MTEHKQFQILLESFEVLAFVVLSMCPYPLFKASRKNICESLSKDLLQLRYTIVRNLLPTSL